MEQGILKDDTCLQKEYEAQHGSDVIAECLEKEQGILTEDTCLQNEYGAQHGSDVIAECLEKEQGILTDDTCLQKEYETQHGSDVIAECLEKKTSDFVRPEASLVDGMKWLEIRQLLRNFNLEDTSLRDNKQKLKKRLFSGQRIDSMSKKMKDVLNTTVQSYKGLKTNLLEIYADVITSVENESFKNKMSKEIEMRFPHYEEELKSIKTVLQNMTEEFEIFVFGGPCSDKSTFINVLLGERILPSHHLHTTASMYRLHNSEKRRIKCYVEKSTVNKISLTADSNTLRKTLSSITKKLPSNDRDDEPIKPIDIYWPVSSLHESVILVNTPEIGQPRDALTRQVVEFVPKSAGFIFICDSFQADGFQDYEIRKWIEALAVSASKEDHIKSLSNMIFVCNNWNTKRKLRKYCGDFGEWQIITFDGNLEMKLLEWKANPTDDFKTLLQSLKTLMIRTIETRLGDKYRWIRTFVSELLGLFKGRINAGKQSKEDVQLAVQWARNQLDIAAKQLETACSDVEALIEKEEKSLLQDLEEYLKSEGVQSEHFNWTYSAPKISKVKEDGPALIIRRLQNVIFKWATSETGPIKEASFRITNMCKEIQSEINSTICILNFLDLGFSLKKSSDQSDSRGSDETDMSLKSIAIVVASSTFWNDRLLLEVDKFPEIVTAISKITNTKKQRITTMTKLTKHIIDIFVSENHMQTYIADSFTSHYMQWLTKFKHDTKCRITSTCAWLLHMETDSYQNNDELQIFQSLQAKLNHFSNLFQKIKNDI